MSRLLPDWPVPPPSTDLAARITQAALATPQEKHTPWQLTILAVAACLLMFVIGAGTGSIVLSQSSYADSLDEELLFYTDILENDL